MKKIPGPALEWSVRRLESAYHTVLHYSKLDLWYARDLSVLTEYSTVNMRSAGLPPQKGPPSYLKRRFGVFSRRPLEL